MKRIAFTLLLALASTIQAADILTGAGDATFYYDINGGGTCGPVNGINSFPETGGYCMCEGTNPNPHILSDYGTDNIVAMPNQLLGGNLAQYCGKKVIPSINGVAMDLGLFIWDGCEACNANDGLDFSSTVFGELFGADRCAEGRISGELTWVITDEQVIPFDSANGGGTTATLPVTTGPPS
jgi:hypothetical protein